MNEISGQKKRTNAVTMIIRVVLQVVIGAILIAILGGISVSTNMGRGVTGLIGIILLYALWILLKKINIGSKNN